MADVPVIWPASGEVFLAVAGMVLLLLGAFSHRRAFGLVAWGGVVALVVAMLINIGIFSGTQEAFNGLYIADAFGLFAKVLILLGSALVLVLAMPYLRREGVARFEFPVLIVFATLGMSLMVSANDLLLVYLGLEMQSLALYVCAAFRRDNLRSTEAGLKYFVLGALASGMMLYGLSLIYGFSGTTSFSVLAEVVGGDSSIPMGLTLGLVFLVVGLAFKVSAAPFHMWTPDVYEGAPTPVTAFFASAPKVAAIALTLRVLLQPFGDLVGQWQQIVLVVAILSMAVGALAALVQTNIKRLMAYSSIGHMGYVLVGVAAGSELGVKGVLIYLSVYVFMNLGAFAVILSMRREGRMVEEIADLSGLARTHPVMAAMMAVFMFSMAGIPPLAGFFAKLYVFVAAIEAGLVGLAIIGVITSVIAAFYYLRVVKVMYFDQAREGFDRPIGAPVGAVMGLAAVITLLFFLPQLGPGLVETNASAAAATLVGG